MKLCKKNCPAMSVEVDAAVVNTSAQKSAASKEWRETLSHDAERKARALKQDAADELVGKMTEEALGRTFSSCAALKDIVGACEHEQAKMHCPQTCGLCAALGAQEDIMNRRQLDKCAE